MVHMNLPARNENEIKKIHTIQLKTPLPFGTDTLGCEPTANYRLYKCVGRKIKGENKLCADFTCK